MWPALAQLSYLAHPRGVLLSASVRPVWMRQNEAEALKLSWGWFVNVWSHDLHLWASFSERLSQEPKPPLVSAPVALLTPFFLPSDH